MLHRGAVLRDANPRVPPCVIAYLMRRDQVRAVLAHF